ncbi:MAG TPA: helix-turn-helix transcriptional regulator [Vicinamibacterales bacterium]|nr:helix-turn-helix transcriptional regulator [Vicinamibacterales bacterium]
MPGKPQSLAEFELLVLLAALHLGADEAYTVSIADYIEQRTGRSVRPANVYTTLQRLEDKRLVATRLGEPRAERGGKPRRLVTVREPGVAAVRATTGAIQAMTRDLRHLLGDAR